MSKNTIMAAVFGSMSVIGIGASAFAATNDSNGATYPRIVQRISDRFGLDPAKVNDVFKEQRQNNQQDREAMLKSRLDQAVKDGKLTQNQEDILMTEIKKLHEQFKSGNMTDRRQNIQDIKSYLERWAKDNGIDDLNDILPQHDMRFHRHLIKNNQN